MLYGMVFVVYYCYGTQLSVYASTTGDFFGTKNLGINYGLLFTAWGVAGIIGPIIAGRLFDIFGNYTNAFYVGSAICVLALGSLLLAKRPEAPAVVGVEVVKGRRVRLDTLDAVFRGLLGKPAAPLILKAVVTLVPPARLIPRHYGSPSDHLVPVPRRLAK